MADIIVTVPRNKINSFLDNIEKCEEKAILFEWSLARKPRHLNINDYVYFLLDNEIQYRMYVTDMIESEEIIRNKNGGKWATPLRIFGECPESIEIFPETVQSFVCYRYLERYPNVVEFYQKLEEGEL